MNKFTLMYNHKGEDPRWVHTCRIIRVKNHNDGRCRIKLSPLKNKFDDCEGLTRYTRDMKKQREECKLKKAWDKSHTYKTKVTRI